MIDPTPVVDYASPIVRSFIDVPVSTVSPDTLLLFAILDTILLLGIAVQLLRRR